MPREVPDTRFILEKPAASEHQGVGRLEVAAQAPRVEVAEGVHLVSGGGTYGVEGGNGSLHAPVGQQAP